MSEADQLTGDIPLIDGFQIVAKLGHSERSAVWEAKQVSLGRTVVIKVLSERLTHDAEDVAQFKREAQIAANLKHPGIVQVYDFGQSKRNGRYYVVMEYITGYSVGDWLRRKGKLREADALTLAHSVAEALRYAWDQSKIIHCDIKPDNIMVDGDGTIKITDLGLAQAVSSLSAPPAAADEIVIMGTPLYMSPEQARGEKQLDCRTDMYALGATLYHLVTGTPPFVGPDANAVLEKQIAETPEYPQKRNPELSTGMARLILKMMAKKPEARHQTWREVMDDVMRLGNLAAVATSPAAAAKAQHANVAIEREFVRTATATPPAARAPAIVVPPPAASVPAPGDPAAGGADEFKACPYCAEPIRKNAVYCRFCRRDLEDGGAKPKRASRYGQGRAPRPASASVSDAAAAPASSASSAPSAAPSPPARAAAYRGPWRMLISLALLSVIGVYAYQLKVHDHDIFAALRSRIMEWGSAQIEKLTAFFSEAEAPALASDAHPAAARSAERAAPPGPSPVAKSPLPPTVSGGEAADPAYQRLLKSCAAGKPVVGSQVSIRLKNQRYAVSGQVEAIDDSGVRLRVRERVMDYAFDVMLDESRLLFFPEEHARRLLQESKAVP